MGLNIAGLITKTKIENEQGIEEITGDEVKYIGEVRFDDAISFKDDKYIDLLSGKSGSLLITSMGSLYDITGREDNTVQFNISDVSDTYYFEIVSKGEIIRRFIISGDEIIENKGEGWVDENSDITSVIWELTNEYLDNNEDFMGLTFKRFEIL